MSECTNIGWKNKKAADTSALKAAVKIRDKYPELPRDILTLKTIKEIIEECQIRA